MLVVLLEPPQRVPEELGGRHVRVLGLPGDRGQRTADKTHVMVERQPAHPAVGADVHPRVDRTDVRREIRPGDTHPARDAAGTGRELQDREMPWPPGGLQPGLGHPRRHDADREARLAQRVGESPRAVRPGEREPRPELRGDPPQLLKPPGPLVDGLGQRDVGRDRPDPQEGEEAGEKLRAGGQDQGNDVARLHTLLQQRDGRAQHGGGELAVVDTGPGAVDEKPQPPVGTRLGDPAEQQLLGRAGRRRVHGRTTE